MSPDRNANVAHYHYVHWSYILSPGSLLWLPSKRRQPWDENDKSHAQVGAINVALHAINLIFRWDCDITGCYSCACSACETRRRHSLCKTFKTLPLSVAENTREHVSTLVRPLIECIHVSQFVVKLYRIFTDTH